jgi:hypothetical protein
VQVLCKLVLDMKLALTPRDEFPVGPRLSDQWREGDASEPRRPGS